MKKLTAMLALLMLQILLCSQGDTNSIVAGYVGQKDVVSHEYNYPPPAQDGDSTTNEVNYLSIFPIEASQIPYIKQISGAICLVYALLLLDSYKN